MALRELGFRTVFVPRYIFQVQPESPILPSTADPRGLLLPGMVPSKSIQYKLINYVKEQVLSTGSPLAGLLGSGLGGGVLSTISSLSVFGDIAFVKIKIQASILVFEGHDVIDLSTEKLTKEENTITVPDKVFRPLFAGNDKFIKEGDNLGLKSAQAYGGFLEDNLIRGIVITPNAPPDVKNGPKGLQSVDSLSDKILLKETASYISYVAADRLVFRDVINIEARLQAIGVVNPLVGFLATGPTSVISADASVLRYVPITKTEKQGEKEVSVVIWKLSESIGKRLIPEAGIQQTPPEVKALLTDTQRAQDLLESRENHAVYNLNDFDGDDLTDGFEAIPLKIGYSPFLARAMKNPADPLYDENFKAEIQEYKLGFASTGTLVEPEQAFASGTGGRFTADILAGFSYFSQNYQINLPQNGRLGLEYSVSIHNNILSTPDTIILLAKTSEFSAGIAATIDHALSNIRIFDIEQGQKTIVERVFDDFIWTQTKLKKPESELNQYMIGESSPYRSEGGTLLLPDVTTNAVKGDIEIPDDSFVVTVTISADKEKPFGIKLLDSEDAEKPVFEVYFPNGTGIEEGTAIVVTPPLKFAFTKDGSLSAISTAKNDEEILEEFPDGDKSSPSGLQQGEVDELTFPVEANNIHACSESKSNMIFVAYEHEDRIDLMIRTDQDSPFGIVRDVVLRIPDNFESTEEPVDENDLPPAGLPFLIADEGTETLLLFYTYKGKLLVKKIPMEVFLKPKVASKNRRYSLGDEVILMQEIHKIQSYVVYDGEGDDSSIEIDIKLGSIRTSNQKEAGNDNSRRVTQYSVCQHQAGGLFAFIQTEDKAAYKKSFNLGDSWVDALPSTFSFIPSKDGDDVVYGESPYCCIDCPQNAVFIFLFMERSLLFVRFPQEVFLKTKESAANELSKIKPVVLVGPLTQDMLDRGITGRQSVKNDKTSEGINPHRVAAIISDQGYSRLFYKDSEQVLGSLISTSGGTHWLTEEEYTG